MRRWTSEDILSRRRNGLKHIPKLFFRLAVATLISDCATTSSLPMRSATGTWYGSGIQPQIGPELIHWIIHRRPNGTFQFISLTERSCRLYPNTIESGRWAISNGLYTVVTDRVNDRAVDSSDHFYQDIYEIKSFTHDSFQFKSIAYDLTFQGRRVAEDFKPVPKCREAKAENSQ